MSTTGFYQAFQDRYRGSRALIKSRLETYLPFVEKILEANPKYPTALDLGCGRGEWIELLQEKGFDACGVDLDADTLAACEERGLRAEQGDAVNYLRSLEDSCLCMVSAFHFAEHISFDLLESLVIEAHRVLKPAGLLLIETPNPENIVVGASDFYLDPTHIRPIPPLLLSFLPELHNYARVRVARLQESKDLLSKTSPSLIEVLSGVSPDYSVIAQKDAADDRLELFDSVFAMPFGIELRTLSARYDAAIAERFDKIERRLQHTEAACDGMTATREHMANLQQQLIKEASEHARLAELNTQLQSANRSATTRAAKQERRASSAEAAEATAKALVRDTLDLLRLALGIAERAKVRADDAKCRIIDQNAEISEQNAVLERTRRELDQLNQSNHVHWQLAMERGREVEALRTSWSWRITFPVRWVGAFAIRQVSTLPPITTRYIEFGVDRFQRLLGLLISHVLKRTATSHHINNLLLQRFPSLHRHLLQVAEKTGAVPTARGNLDSDDQTGTRHQLSLSELTPQARRIFLDLRCHALED